uniref:Late control gene D protein homolog n=1 Tax=Salmonella typhi TaxID=90370 RepID=O52746_SALTI|nr:late control gene D protein homolog [Salmonella enterica subsp. enterica serovar Typhi]
MQRGVASFSLQLAEGRADLYTEMPVKVSGFKQPIDDAEWTITTLTHTVSPDNGFTTSLELEVRIDDSKWNDSSQWRTFKFAKWNNAVSLL